DQVARAHHAPSVPSSRDLLVCSLGTMSYATALDLQRAVAKGRIAGAIDQDVLLLVEHPHVVTLGRAAKGRTLTTSPAILAARGVELFEVDRGGDVTYHGPGQLVGYPIFDLKRHKQDLHWYLRQVEEALIMALRAWGLEGSRSAGYTGVWVGDESQRGYTDGHPNSAQTHDARRKIASIGVHARDWVTWHGFALNVTTDLSFFELMIPCGIDGVHMTSIEQERRDLQQTVDPLEIARSVSNAFATVFQLNPQTIDPCTLRERLGEETLACAH
ncbi:MAG: lipoyl(octanoyl) transferase LipB, partial [Gemmatimonadaceae bacterium]